MADLSAWVVSARARLDKYQKERGVTAGDRPNYRDRRFVKDEERGAGRELSGLAKQVPPL